MKIHELIVSSKPELVPFIKTQAKKLGLDKIPHDDFYIVYKEKAKNSSPSGIPDKGVIIKGLFRLVGSKEHVAFYIEGISDYFRSSSIEKCTKVEGGFRIETANSVYIVGK